MKRSLITQAKFVARCFGNDDYIHTNESIRFHTKVYSRGVHARYRQLNSKWGMKFFAFKEQRDQTFDIHKMLIKEKLGPEIFGKFQCKNRHGQMVYGYIIEHVKINVLDTMEKYKLRETGRKLGISDLHSLNIGKTSSGLPVIIDCSYIREGESGSAVFNFYALDDMSGGETITNLLVSA